MPKFGLEFSLFGITVNLKADFNGRKNMPDTLIVDASEEAAALKSSHWFQTPTLHQFMFEDTSDSVEESSQRVKDLLSKGNLESVRAFGPKPIPA